MELTVIVFCSDSDYNENSKFGRKCVFAKFSHFCGLFLGRISDQWSWLNEYLCIQVS